jgi:hypothetical protein
LNLSTADTLVVDGVLDMTGGGNGLGASNDTINAGGTVVISGTDDASAPWVINGGTYTSNDAYSSATFNFDNDAGGVVDLPADSIWNTAHTITNFTAGDQIDLGSISSTASVTTSLSANNLEILQNGTIVAEVENFTLASDATTAALEGTIVAGQYVVEGCFCAGTRLATAAGGIAVENVTAGTLLKTASGAVLPVRWLGRSAVSTRFADKLRTLPIRIKSGALGENIPARDLLVSPCHALFIGGVLIQAGALVNGVSIVRETHMPEIFTYYHVELASHELLAEGAAAESFVDNIDRMNFNNWAEHAGGPMAEMAYPRAKAPRQVPIAVRRLLAGRAAQSGAARAA